jgi:anhydro-N-acetylmuramic acid kinase
MNDRQLWVGLMSGTSLDGVDGVAAWLGSEGQWLGSAAHAFEPLPPALHAELLALNTPTDNELHRAALAAQGVSRCYAQVVAQLMTTLQAQHPGLTPQGIGAHGQTVRHRPELGYTLQLINPALLAELTGLPVVADFRSRDVAAGGQGAPLVPVFHQTVFSQNEKDVVVANIGGMANVSLLPATRDSRPPMGFDCGPGNVLMDLWCQQHQGTPYDADGAWARTGQVNPDWLALAMAEPFFALPPPKSTGRDLFNPAWLANWLQRCGSPHHAQAADVQATLCELTAQSMAQATVQACPAVGDVLVCGGGALNAHLMARLAAQLQALRGQPVAVHSTATRGLPPMEVEAAAFAWLAWACQHGVAGNVSAVTGARGPRVLGAVYPA